MEAAQILLSEIPETLHVLSKEGEARVEKDEELCPGINCCALCAIKITGPVVCPKCKRVEYCSQSHMKSDHEAHSLVCPVLSLINKLEAQEIKQADMVHSFKQTKKLIKEKKLIPMDGWPIGLMAAADSDDAEGADGPSKKKRKTDKSSGASPDAGSPSLPRLIALARSSSFLTYPLTVCYYLTAVPNLAVRLERRWRAKQTATIAILGASSTAELLWPKAWRLLDDFLYGPVRLVFVGPEIDAALAVAAAPDGRLSEKIEATFLAEEAVSASSSASSASSSPRLSALLSGADCLVAFNPGFTCPDYDWSAGLDAIESACRVPFPSAAAGSSKASSSQAPPPLFVSTNTEMEGQFDAEWLMERGWLPAGSAHRNPMAPLRLLQSGTLGNDIYRKNAYVGCFVHQDSLSDKLKGEVGEKRKKSKPLKEKAGQAAGKLGGRDGKGAQKLTGKAKRPRA